MKISFEIGGIIQSDFFGKINCNFNDLKGRLKLRKFQSVDLENEFKGVCVLPNGKLVITK
jgi:hypothetical protein